LARAHTCSDNKKRRKHNISPKLAADFKLSIFGLFDDVVYDAHQDLFMAFSSPFSAKHRSI